MSLAALTPLFAGMPGGVELAIIFVMAIIVFGIPALVVVFGGGYLLRRSRSDVDEDRVAELEAKVAELEAELDGDEEEERAALDDDHEDASSVDHHRET